MRPSLTRSTTRLPGVDVIRGLCIFAVVIHHINLRIRFNKSSIGAVLPNFADRALFWSGSYAVKVFFVVSGFLITSTILSRWGTLPAIDVKVFYRLRAARIGPLLLTVLAILSVLHLARATGFIINPSRASLPRALTAALTFHVNWLEPHAGYLPGAWDILWSLSVEEVFYLGYPLLCRFFGRKWIPLTLLGLLMIAGPFFRTVLARNEIASDYAYFANMDCIALGCAAAVVAHSREVRGTLWIGTGLVIWIVVLRNLVALLGLYKTGLDVTVLAIGTALVLLAMRANAEPSAWTAPLRWFGRNSYEVYLTHMFVVTVGTQLFTAWHAGINTAWLWFVAMPAISGLLGHAVAQWYSEPWRRKLLQPYSPVESALTSS